MIFGMQTDYSILLIDDSPGECQLFQLALLQVRPDVALSIKNDPHEGLRFLRECSSSLPHAILLDWHLGKSRGDEFLAELRLNASRRGTPVVVFTTSDDLSNVSASYASGANSYVVKPNTFEELIAFAQDFCAFWLGWNRIQW